MPTVEVPDYSGSKSAGNTTSNMTGVNASRDVFSEVRDHISQLNGLLQGVSIPEDESATTPTTETKQVAAEDKEDKDALKTDSKTKAGGEENGNTADADSKGSSAKGIVGSDLKITITKKGRELALERRDSESVSAVPGTVKRKKGEYAFIYLKNLEEKGNFKSSLIEIEDEELLKVLSKTRVESRPTYYRESRQAFPELLLSPFEDIVWIYDRLRTLTSASEEPDSNSEVSASTLSDLSLLLEYIADDPSLASYWETRRNRKGQIAFEHIWTLFPAGVEIVAKPYLDTDQILCVHSPPYHSGARSSLVRYSDEGDERWHQSARQNNSRFWSISAWCYDHNGRDWLRVCHEFIIKEYDGERSIDELMCYPLDNHKDPTALRKECIRIGERFTKLFDSGKAPPRFDYDSHIMIDKRAANRALFAIDSDASRYWRRLHAAEQGIGLITNKIKQEVVVDPEPWNDRYGTVHIGRSEPVDTLDSTETDMDDNTFVPVPKGDMVRFCPPRFLGCLPKDRLIAQFKVEAVNEENRVGKDDKLFNKELQLDQDTRNLLLAQVRYQKDDPDRSTDIIRGKGNNLVVLLHGPPGVGKTLTAETVAQATDRPLLYMSIADVGTQPQHAEAQLSKIFAVASRWKAILLIDEADAFLEKRDSMAAPERNAFVTVMLRILEYHTGIVILTTNRLTTLDSAVQSRIHLAVKYEELQKIQCINIFRTSVEKSRVKVREEDMVDMVGWLERDALDEQKDLQKAWNGREIRNLVTGAVAIMAFRNEESLKREHLQEVFRSTKAFKKQLEEQMWSWKRDNQGRR